jgi:hypothetical protein
VQRASGCCRFSSPRLRNFSWVLDVSIGHRGDVILGRLFALSEAYPDLKANQNMLALQEELTSTENKIGLASW